MNDLEHPDLSNAELMLLLLLTEEAATNGYTLNQRIVERGYRAWADIGTTSIYTGLKKLERRGLASSAPDTEKRGRGPRGKVYSLTDAGRAIAREEVKRGLSTTREHDPRFNLALCGVHLLSDATFRACLKTRRAFLTSEVTWLEAERASQTPDRSASLLFGRIIHGIRAEIAWLEQTLHTLTPEDPGD